MIKLLTLVASIAICVIAAPQSQIRSKRDGNLDLFAISENRTEQLVGNGQNVSAADIEGISIYAAAENGLEKVVERLIQDQSDVDAKNNNGNTALHLAAIWGHEKVVQLLIEHGSNVSVTDIDGNTPLHLASDWGHDKVVQLLLKHGSNASVTNTDGYTPLHWAVRLGHDKVVQLLIEHGSNVFAMNNDGNTALHLAAVWGNGELVKQLIKRGINVSATNNEGNTPMLLAASWGHDIVVQLLIEHGSNVSAVNNDGNTALHLSASEGRDKVVELLWKKGVDLHIKNVNGEEPLALAVRQYHMNVVNLLGKAIEREDKIQNLIKACDYYSMENPDFYINNGNRTELGEFPWMAALVYLDPDEIKNRVKCGGTIISEQYILTAAHCAETDNQPFRVRLGGVNLGDGNAKNYAIKEIILHPNYSKRYAKNDIALIKVDREILFNKNLRPACIGTVLSDELSNVGLNVTGWGSTTPERTNTTMQLLKAVVTTVPLAECNATYLEYDTQAINTPYRNGIDESQYCAHDPKGMSGSCYGDSGAPLQIFRNPRAAHVVGIVSAGIACGALPTIHTRVAYYAEWIASHFCFNCISETEN